jgi:hypothetical protein
MKAGGFEPESKDPEIARRSVAITLGKNTQTFTRVPSTGSWGLAEWYPGAKRNKPSDPNDASKDKAAANKESAGTAAASGNASTADSTSSEAIARSDALPDLT